MHTKHMNSARTDEKESLYSRSRYRRILLYLLCCEDMVLLYFNHTPSVSYELPLLHL